MVVKKANLNDLDALLTFYREVIKDMHQQGYEFWDEDYPIQDIKKDVKNGACYFIEEKGIVSAFSLNPDNVGQGKVRWTNDEASFMYLDRLAIHPRLKRQGYASRTIKEAMRLTKKMNKEYLRLFVAEKNHSAIHLYEALNFIKSKDSFYDIVNNIEFEEWGYEVLL